MTIVDDCFHRYASSYRSDAREYAEELIKEVKGDCTGCRHEPYKKEMVYPEQCGECSRFYADGYEARSAT